MDAEVERADRSHLVLRQMRRFSNRLWPFQIKTPGPCEPRVLFLKAKGGVPTPTRTAINSLGNYCSILLSYGDTAPMSRRPKTYASDRSGKARNFPPACRARDPAPPIFRSPSHPFCHLFKSAFACSTLWATRFVSPSAQSYHRPTDRTSRSHSQLLFHLLYGGIGGNDTGLSQTSQLFLNQTSSL